MNIDMETKLFSLPTAPLCEISVDFYKPLPNGDNFLVDSELLLL